MSISIGRLPTASARLMPVIRVNAGLAHTTVALTSVMTMPLAAEFSAASNRRRRDSSFWRTTAWRIARPSASCSNCPLTR
ncbi:MAG: hypothetical protein AW07_04791 [Candidatus Accumulibacter sp. SK-11]|nr:MAG: hypothetical protein AW07_04791 [Candidatus Accumulibacter sp. SK-11]